MVANITFRFVFRNFFFVFFDVQKKIILKFVKFIRMFASSFLYMDEKNEG